MWSPTRLFSAAALCLALASAYDSTACNNSPDLCDKHYSEIWHLGAHDSAFVRNKTNNYSDAGNQYYNATVQLDGGVRLLQSQIHLSNNDIRLCHTTCTLFDFGSLEDYLQMVSDWMNSHESEVVTLLIVNDDKIAPSSIAKVFESTGLTNLTYTPVGISGPSDWPTLSTLIKDKSRLITFLSAGADTASVGYMLDEFTYIFETPFDATDISNITCTADRPSNVQGQIANAAKTMMGLQNHFLDQTVSSSLNIQIPNETYASTLNSGSGTGNLATSISNCTKQWEWNGGFMLVDFFNEGDPISVIDKANNVTTAVNRVDAPSGSPQSGDSTNSSSTGGGWAEIQSLAKEAKSGTQIPLGEWIFNAGGWIGSIGSL